MISTPRALFLRSFTHLFVLGCLLGTSGCDSSPPAKPKKKIATREIIRKTTQDVRKLEDEVGQGGQVTDNKVTAKDYITLQSDVYKNAITQITEDQIGYAIRLYEAEHGELPKTYEEFMELIIKKGKPDGIQLPMLPFYQEWGYDEKNHKLIVIEYPAKKAEQKKQQDEELGR
jgi:hypothetical protein